MSDVNEDGSGNPRTPPRTPPRLHSDQPQEEDVLQDTPRYMDKDSGEYTTRGPLCLSIEDPMAIVKTLEEYTTRTSLRPGDCIRNLEENTPKIPLNTTGEEQHSDPRVTTSPATSTPGASPAGSTNGELKDSELQCSEESVIESSITTYDSKKEKESEEIVFVKLVNTTLAGNSVAGDEDESLNVEDTLWDTTAEYTIVQEGGAKSCVAQRTRSRTEELRRLNMTELMDACTQALEESYEVIDHNAMDSLNLPRHEREKPEWKNKEDWCGKLQEVDSSMNKAYEIRGPKKQEEMLKMYRKRTAELARMNEEMKQKQVGMADNLEEEIKEIKHVTFMVEEPAYASVLQEVILALETLVVLKLDNAPIKHVENIIKIIISICIDFNIQVQTIQETMKSMAGFIKELLVQRYRIEIVNLENKRLEEEKQAVMEENSNLKVYNQVVKGVADSFVNKGKSKEIKENKEKKRDLIAEIVEYKVKITELQVHGKNRDELYAAAYNRKEHYKRLTAELESKIKELKEEMKKEKEREARERQASDEERQRLGDEYERVTEVAHDLEEKMDRLRISHQADIERMIEERGVESDRENGRRLKAEERVLALEQELKKVRKDLFKTLRERDDELVVVKRENVAVKTELNEKEKLNSRMGVIINNLRKEMEVKNMEIEAFRYFSQLFGEEDPKKIFDPEHPKRRYKPRSRPKSEKSIEGGDEGFGSEINTTTDVSNMDLQSSTAGVDGDTERDMDTTLDQEDTTLEPQTPKGAKRKKVEMAGAEKVDEMRKENLTESSEESNSSRRGKNEKEPNKKKKLSKHREDKMDSVQEKLDRQMEELKKEHDRKMDEQEKKNAEGMEALRSEMEQKSSQQIENIKKEYGARSIEVQEPKADGSQGREPRGHRETHGAMESPSNSLTESQMTQLTPAQKSAPLLQTPTPQYNETQARYTPGISDPPTQYREGSKPAIVTITHENMDRVVSTCKGLLQNPDGTMSVTPQFNTWTKNNNMQLQKLYVANPGFPAEIDSYGHPEVTLLDLNWTHEGEWVIIPSSKNDKGPVYRDSRIARIEKYIDLKGKIRRAVSYGDDETKIKEWFNIEDVMKAFPNWNIPNPSPYYNGKKFSPGYRRKGGVKTVPKPHTNPRPNPQPRDQSGRDIQGRRGGQQYHRGRGRGYRGNQPRVRVETYRDWDNQQSAGIDGEKWEQDAWEEYQQTTAVEKGARPKEYRSSDQNRDQQHPRPQRETHRSQKQPRDEYQRERGRGNSDQEYDQSDPQEGYFTKEYEARKRAQSRGHHRDDQSTRPRDDSRHRHKEVSRDRHSERRHIDRSVSSRRQKERSSSPSPRGNKDSGRGRGRQRERSNTPRSDRDSGRGRGGRQRERSHSPKNGSGKRREGRHERRGSDASYGDT